MGRRTKNGSHDARDPDLALKMHEPDRLARSETWYAMIVSNRWFALPFAAGLIACSTPDTQRENEELRERISKLEVRLVAVEVRAETDLSPFAEGMVRAADHHHERFFVQGLSGCGADGDGSFQGQTLVTREAGGEQCDIPNLGLRSAGSPCSSDYDVLVTVAPARSGAEAVTHRLEVRDSPPDAQGNGTHGSLAFECGHPALVTMIQVHEPGGGG